MANRYRFIVSILSILFGLVACGGGGGSGSGTGSTGGSIPGSPAAPSGLMVAALSTTSTGLLWTDNSTDETGFKIERSTSASGPFTLVTTTAANAVSYNDSGLNPSTTYYYQVRATNNVGDSANTSVVSITTPASVTIPAAPSALVATAISSSSIVLTWTDNSTNETGFKIYHGAGGPMKVFSTSSANVATFTFNGLTAASTYNFFVVATNSAGDSAPTVVVFATTQAVATIAAAPTGLTATAAVNSINLSWTDASTNETSFKIERSASGAGSFTQIGTTAANTTVYTDAGLTVTPYDYRVRASNSAGDSAYTLVATATALAPVSGSLTATFSPVTNNLIMYSTWTNTTANTAYPTGELAVGTDWSNYIDPFGTVMFAYLRAESLVKFNVASLAGKTIDSAILTLTLQYYAPYNIEYPWHIWALQSAWDSRVTFNTVAAASFIYWIPNGLYLYPPTSNITNYNIQPIVQNWANGNWANQGLWFTPDYSLMPLSPQNEAFAFYSTATATAAGHPSWAPLLTVIYH